MKVHTYIANNTIWHITKHSLPKKRGHWVFWLGITDDKKYELRGDSLKDARSKIDKFAQLLN